jgi:hypothetical protein
MSNSLIKSDDPKNLSSKLLIKRSVVLRTVEDVIDADFEQARITMEAWEAIGWDSGRAVANALSDGHGYKIKEIILNERFSERIRNTLRETAFAASILLSYNIRTNPDIKLIGSSNSSGKELVVQSQDLVLKEDKESKVIEMTAIVKGKLPQIGNPTLKIT